MEREREERYHHHDDSMSSALVGAAIGGLAGYALGSHDDYNPFDGGGFGNDDNGFIQLAGYRESRQQPP